MRKELEGAQKWGKKKNLIKKKEKWTQMREMIKINKIQLKQLKRIRKCR